MVSDGNHKRMDSITPPFFITRNIIIFICACFGIIFAVIYFESIPNQTVGEGMDSRVNTVYFTIRNYIFSGPEGDEWYDEYKKHAIYKKFKTVYPESVDEFGFTTNGTPILNVHQYDSHGNAVDLTFLKCGDVIPFCYHVSCFLYGNPHPNAAPFEAAFDFLDNAECLQE